MSDPERAGRGDLTRRLRRSVRRWAATVVVATLAGCLARGLAEVARIPADASVGPSDVGTLFGLGAGLIHLMLTNGGRTARVDRETRRLALAGPPADGTARVLISRRGPLGFGVEVDAIVDGRVRARLKSPRSATLELAPGPHELAAAARDDASPPLAVVLAAGETAAFRIHSGLRGLRIAREDADDRLRRRLGRVAMVEPTSDPARPRGGTAAAR